MSPVTIGTEIQIVDELAPVVAPTATDPLFLLHSDVATAVTITSAAQGRTAFTGSAGLVAIVDAYFAEGGATIHAAPLVDNAGTPVIADSVAAFPADMGPGQLVAPEVNTAQGLADLADFAFDTNRIYIADAADGATDAALGALGDALIGATGGRFASLEADTLLIPGIASGTTREVPASVVKAALIARNDRDTGNPNLAAAGVNGQTRYVVGIQDERDETRRAALADHGINTFRRVYGRIRSYGYRSTADLDNYPHWWDLSGARTVMTVRAREQEVAEAHMFGQIDREGVFFASYETALAAVLRELQNVGALYGTTTQPGYTVSAGWDVNTPADIRAGRVAARITLRTSPFAEHIVVSIIRRPVDQEV